MSAVTPGRAAGQPVASGGRRRAVRAVPDTGLLPQPPSDYEKYTYAKRHLWILTVSSLVSFCCLLVSQVALATTTVWMWAYLPVLVFTVVYYLISLWVNGFSRDFDVKAHRKLVREWHPEHYPSVDVFLPVCGEPIEVLHNTWSHVRQLADRYPGTVVPFVLDDGASPELAAMAADFGFRYGSRPDRGWFKKAGNLHFGFGCSAGEFILILDADFTPAPTCWRNCCPTWRSTSASASSSRRSTSGCSTRRTGSSAAPARSRSCSTARCRCPGRVATARSAWAVARCTGGRRWTPTGAPR